MKFFVWNGPIPITLYGCSVIYSIAWILGSPFLDPDQVLQSLFPPRKYALLLAATFSTTYLVAVAFIGGWILYFGANKPIFKNGVDREIAVRDRYIAEQLALWKHDGAMPSVPGIVDE